MADYYNQHSIIGLNTPLVNQQSYESKMHSIYRISDAQPDWAEQDPSQPDYIKNKQMAERFRPILVNGELFLGEDLDSGAVNFVAGVNVNIRTEKNNIVISATSGTGAEFEPGNGILFADTVEGKKIIYLDPLYSQAILRLVPLVGRYSEKDETGTTIIQGSGLCKRVEDIENQFVGLDAKILEQIAQGFSELPAATIEAAGLVKLSDEIGVDEEGNLSVTALSTDKLVQGEKTLILCADDELFS